MIGAFFSVAAGTKINSIEASNTDIFDTKYESNLGEKIVQQEYRKGYMIGDKVLRHSMVIVAN